MAKTLLIIVCVCYCTVCLHLAMAQLAKKDFGQHNANEFDSLIESPELRNSRKTNEWSMEHGHRRQRREQMYNHNAVSGVDHEQPTQYVNDEKTNFYSNDIESSLENGLSVRDRRKRHAGGHSHHDEHIDLDSFVEINSNTQQFIQKLFHEFGDSEKETMTVTGFERMVRRLGLDRLIEDHQMKSAQISDISRTTTVAATSTATTSNSSSNAPINQTCISSVSLISKVSSTQSAANAKNIESYNNLMNEIKGQSKLSNELNSIASTDQIDNATSIDKIKDKIEIGRNDLWSLCPILLYQLVSEDSLERAGCIKTELLPSEAHHDHHIHYEFGETNRTLVWVYASLSIIIASLCGLLGVAVIPCMEKRYYQHILQFFVALAIGTLTGDALLHLMPHAMMTFSTIGDTHTSMTYKGLVAALGIIFFFLFERILTMVAEWRKQIHKRDDPPARVRVMREPDSVSVNQSLNGEKQCKHKYSSYPYCYDEIAMETKDNHHHHHQHGSGHSHSMENGLKLSSTSPPKEKLCAKTLNDRANDYSDTAQSLLNSRNHNSIGMTDAYYRSGEKDDVQTPDNNTILTNLDDGSLYTCGCEQKKTLTPENYTIILREHESKHHGHSHTHGHVHSPPKTLSAVAWMVVMGDGLHNFTDGMAIGAAFSNSITGGFSTAIAVFCHELPHELGDFAVLLKAGMSAKKAAYYNILSSVLSFLGMMLGIYVGDTPEASAWIFAAAAGMFIYIALVDMMPELTTAHNEHTALTQCFLQFIGMVIGVAIMLLIALFENDLKSIFASDDHHRHDH